MRFVTSPVSGVVSPSPPPPPQAASSRAQESAKALAGKKPGDRITVPTEDGGEGDCVLQAIEALPPEIVDWAQ